MPTGYTAFIEDGKITTAKDFLMLCARAFDATVEMREEPLSKPIPEKLEPSDYHTKSLESARKRLEQLRVMTEDEIGAEIESEHTRRVEEKRKSQEKNRELKSRYMEILRDVTSWTPPTSEHEGLKKFAVEQIEMCLPETSWGMSESLPEKETPAQWTERNLASCLRDIEYHEKEERKEAERCDKRNKWLRDLRESLSKQFTS